MSKNLDQFVEELSGLTVLEMSKLKEMLENKWGVKAAAAAAPMMMAAAAPAAAGVVEEASAYQITLTEAPADKKIGIIKVWVAIKGIGSGRESALRSLAGRGLEILAIKDVTPVPHNGCRPPKVRRV